MNQSNANEGKTEAPKTNMRIFNKEAIFIPAVIAMLTILASCEKDSSEPEWPKPNDTEESTNPDGGENDGFEIGDLRYKISTNATDECYVAGMSKHGVVNHLIIPNEVTNDGKAYRVTEIGDHAKISALSVITSDNMNVINSYAFTSDLQQLIVGANVKEVSPDAWNTSDGPYEEGYYMSNGNSGYYKILSNYTRNKVSKIIWLPNTQPRGVTFRLGGKINYVSEDYGGLLWTEVRKISELTSMFWVNGILYTLMSPVEKTCIAIGCDYNNNESLSLESEVTNEGITFRITEYGNYVFANNLNLKYVSTGRMAGIKEGSFMYCNNIQSVTLGDDVYGIGDNAFYDCALIQKIEIGPKVTIIGDEALSGCSSVEEFIVHASDDSKDLEVSDSPLFTKDSKLRSITFHRNVRMQNDEYSNLFESVVNLRKVVLIGNCTTVYNNEFKNCSNLSDVQLGDNVTTVGEFAFSGCSAMESFIVGKSINQINGNAFSDCTGLKNFTTEALTPPYCGAQALQDIDKWKCTLHVPYESIGLYQTANQWEDFLFREVL